MTKMLVISALLLSSVAASAVQVRGNGRYYTNGNSIMTIKDACSSAVAAAKLSLSEKCTILGGKLTSEVKITLDPVALSSQNSCTAFAEANCE